MATKVGKLVGACVGVAVVVVGYGGTVQAQSDEFVVTEYERYTQPWALEFLPDGRLLISEMGGTLQLRSPDGVIGEITGVPSVDDGEEGEFGGERGGFADIVLHPNFEQNRLLYFSYVETGEGDTRGAVVARAELALSGEGGSLHNTETLWRQTPKVAGQGHYSHRIAFGPNGYLYISSGERQQADPAQDMSVNLGKILRLNDDGSIPQDNPFYDRGGTTAEIWSLGHRNVLGLAFDASGELWAAELGPLGGDEFNRIRRGANYGWPLASDGAHRDGTPIPNHDTRPEFEAPVLSWLAVISPSSLAFYSGDEFPQWRGDAFVGGLSSRSLVRLEFDGHSAREAQRFDMGRRIRAVEQGPDGALWLLEDGRTGRGNGTLLKLTAAEKSH